MKTLRTHVFVIACILGLGIGTVAAGTDDDDDRGWMPYQHYDYMGMMGPGYGWTGHGPGWMMGPGYGWTGHGPGWMMGPGHGWMGRPPGHVMGYGYGRMMGSGMGWMHRGHAMDPDRLSDKVLDRIGERIAAYHEAMQKIAAEKDPATRRELVREHLKSHRARLWGKYRDSDGDEDDVSHRGYRRGGMMSPGMMSPGMMSPGMMGSGMMGSGMMGSGVMGPGVTHGSKLDDEHLDRMAEQMTENYERMQQIMQTTDKEKRRELMREHFDAMNRNRAGMY